MPSPVHPYSDYGVALRTLRSARSWLALMLFLCVAAQFIGFTLMWWTPQPYEGMRPVRRPPPTVVNISRIIDEVRGSLTNTTHPAASAAPERTDQALFPGTGQDLPLNVRQQWVMVYTMSVAVTQLAALIAISSQSIIIFVTLLVVLIAQAPGIAHITRSFIWSVLVLFMFLPWQYFARDFPIPGIIYGYPELVNFIAPLVAPLPHEKIYGFQIWMVYGRFLVWPLIGLLALLITGERFRAGIMIAIGHPLQSMFQPRPSPAPIPPPGLKIPVAPPGLARR